VLNGGTFFLADKQFKNRHPLRKKDIKRIREDLEERLGVTIEPLNSGLVESAEADEYEVIIVKSDIFGIMMNNKPFLTLKGFLALGESLKSAKKFITVDKGARYCMGSRRSALKATSSWRSINERF
jgi:predicted ribosome-associated RNA-binding protein Tma20